MADYVFSAGLFTRLRRPIPDRPCRQLPHSKFDNTTPRICHSFGLVRLTCAKIHIVHFDVSRRIQSVRLSWDQGSLLKQVDVIGARARSWPIRDGKDQLRLIASSAAATPRSIGPATDALSNGVGNGPGSSGVRGRNNTNATRDPHASLALFSSQNEGQNDKSARGSAIAPKGSAKPPQRYVSVLSCRFLPVKPSHKTVSNLTYS